MRNKLMIGVAAIALVAGTGLASAQGNKEHAAPPAAALRRRMQCERWIRAARWIRAPARTKAPTRALRI